MSECNWPTCGCQNVWGAPWCKAATVRPSIAWTVAQPSPALAALDMRERAAKIAENRNDEIWDSLTGEKAGLDGTAEQIRALPTTFSNDELLAAAWQLPEVRALIEAAKAQLQYMDLCNDKGDLERNLRAALAPFMKAKP